MLAPWPNRIAGGAYTFEGVEYQAKINEPLGNALHGLLFDLPANVLSQETDRLTLVSAVEPRPSFPWNLEVQITFSISEAGLEVETVATNTGQGSAPIGLGTHPFFVFDSTSTLEVRAKAGAIHGPDMIPLKEVPATELGFGEGIRTPIESLPLDLQFSGIAEGAAVLRTQDFSIEVWQKRADWLMVYTTESFNWADGRVRAVAIEPQTCAADAFNTGAGLKVLSPGESFSYVWGVRNI
ncbi:hypothetical protein [Candidatus Aquiluna sp. UB-MaderosW2red]|uniref:aldose epimerase family protein n=1 Tax=Candidatus Aquiluna sp. UB-MaderosW2red TaxID=1855377 RepID=UPI000875BAFC|nr:hypothetical protein [Candidatus Aquiluna sp. UB-MaderosW2red]SCX03984.1 aldose 1-epimerase [Candidatus Aquiluna sp. UB-MaderosW2red]